MEEEREEKRENPQKEGGDREDARTFGLSLEDLVGRGPGATSRWNGEEGGSTTDTGSASSSGLPAQVINWLINC